MLPNIHVITRGRDGATIQQMAQFIRTLPLKRGDIVLFYSSIADAVDVYRSLVDHPQGLCTVPLYTIAVICLHPTDEQIAPRLTALRKRYTENLIDAQHFTQQLDVQFYNIVQPHVWTRGVLSAYEERMLSLSRYTLPETEYTLRKAWPIIEAGAPGVTTIDLTHVLDERRAHGEEFFFDGWHVNYEANVIIANAIYNALFEEI